MTTLSFKDAVLVRSEEWSKAPNFRPGQPPVQNAWSGVDPLPFDDPTFCWNAGYVWNQAPIGATQPWPPTSENFPAWTSNTASGSADASPNGDMHRQLGARSPLIWTPGMLKFAATPVPEDLLATMDLTRLGNITHLSGCITSFPFAQARGIFEMSARLPMGAGMWPAFWLLPYSLAWPPEIDIMECISTDPGKVWGTLHSADWQNIGGSIATGLDLSQDFHQYALDWRSDTLTFYFDRKSYFSCPTPEGMQEMPHYLIANLSVGAVNGWGGPPNASTPNPSFMEIDYIKVWRHAA
jgi:hypothetical protein